MKFQVVIKRDEGTELGRSEPCESVTADGQEDESHIELHSFDGGFSDTYTVTHHNEGVLIAVL